MRVNRRGQILYEFQVLIRIRTIQINVTVCGFVARAAGCSAVGDVNGGLCRLAQGRVLGLAWRATARLPNLAALD